MNLVIRTAEITDAALIAELANQLGYQTTVTDIQKRLSKILTHPDNCAFVLLDEQTVIGWIHGCYCIRVESAPFVEIGGLVVDIQHRGKGIGKMLVQKIIDWALLKDCDKIRVRCSMLRKEAHGFYNSIGFTEIKEQKIFDRQIE